MAQKKVFAKRIRSLEELSRVWREVQCRRIRPHYAIREYRRDEIYLGGGYGAYSNN